MFNLFKKKQPKIGVQEDFQPVKEIVPFFEEPPIEVPIKASTENNTQPDEAVSLTNIPEKEEKTLTLKESIIQATETSNVYVKINKKTVADFLEERFSSNVIANCRENYIKTGILPLADTHYKVAGNGKKCFIYVYELKDEKVFFLVRASKNTVETLQKENIILTHSAFPKNKEQDWYSLFVNDEFSNPQDILETIAYLYNCFDNSSEKFTLKRVDVKTAQNLYTNEEIKKKVEEDSNTDIRYGEEGKEEIINVDTLSENFNDNEEVNIEVLKKKKLISIKSKRIKILARGELDKKLIVVANAYSEDAAKMILALGGKMIKLHRRRK